MRRLSALAGAALLALAAAATLAPGVPAARAQTEAGLPVGSRPPSFPLKTLKGKTLNAARLPGKVVVVDFWATWCGPCRVSIPVLQAMHNRYGSRGLVVIGISDEDRQTVSQFAARNKMTYRLAADPAYRNAISQYQVVGLPTMVILDKKGVVRLYEIGFNPYTSKPRVEALVKKLLAEKA